MNTNRSNRKDTSNRVSFKGATSYGCIITNLPKEKDKKASIIIGECALLYYTREVYFTSDIDLAYFDKEALDDVLKEIGFKKGRYWINEDLKVPLEVPTSVMVKEELPIEIVELAEGLQCRIIGIEDLLI